MNAALEKEISGLTTHEKAEIIDLLLPDVVADDSDPISPEILAELDRRAAAYEKKPVGYTVEQVEAMLFPGTRV